MREDSRIVSKCFQRMLASVAVSIKIAPLSWRLGRGEWLVRCTNDVGNLATSAGRVKHLLSEPLRRGSAPTAEEMDAGTDIPISWNTIKKQYGDSECGLYSISFIINCLTTTSSFQNLCAYSMADDKASNCAREFIFRNDDGPITKRKTTGILERK